METQWSAEHFDPRGIVRGEQHILPYIMESFVI
jgi:hypothetical protein